MSFWTGFTEGLAGSLDRGLQAIMTKRDNELSAAKKFWREREISKMEKAEAEKEKYDKAAGQAFDFLLEGFGGDETKAKAALDVLVRTGGGIEGASKYMASVQEKLGKTGQTLADYNLGLDFKGFEAGETPYTGGREGVMMPEYTGRDFDPVKYGVAETSALDKFFGKEGPSADVVRAREQSKQMFGTGRPDDAPAPAASTARFSGVDRSRLGAAQAEKERLEILERDRIRFLREGKSFDMKVSAFEQNEKRVDQLMAVTKAQEARARRGELNEKEQREYDRNRDAIADARAEVIADREAKKFIYEMRAKKANVTVAEYEASQIGKPPQFKDFEDMAVYAEQKLGEAMPPAERQKYEKLRERAINGAKRWNEETAKTTGGKTSQFSKEGIQSIFNAQLKRTMGKAGLYDSVEDKVAKITQGNALDYFNNFSQAIDAVETTYGTQDETMKNAITAQENELAKDVRRFIDTQLAIPAQKNKRLKKFTGSLNDLMDAAYTQQAYQAGDIVEYKEGDVTKYAIWTGRDLYSGAY